MSMILHPGQSVVFNDLFIDQRIRNSVVVTSRGWGKSHMAAVAGISAVNELMMLPDWVPNKNVYIIAPTYDQVTDIYHPLIVHQLGMKDYCIKESKDAGRIWFPNKVELRLVSFEAVERLRGKGAYFVVNDEVSSWTKGLGFKEAWESVIQPCISTRWSPMHAKKFGAKSPGRSLTISTPKGYNFLYDMFNFQEKDKEWGSYHFDYTNSPLLDPSEIEKIRHTIDPLKFAREYLASFDESGNNVFYCFKRKEHVVDLPWFTKNDDGEITEDIHIGIDFNVMIQASSVAAIRGGQIHYLDEIRGVSDTEQLCTAIKGRYWPSGRKSCKINVYPDPSGNARKTSAATGVTDFTILRNAGFNVFAHKAAPKLVDSVQCVNRMLKTAAGETNMYFSPKCQGLITSMERTSWVDNNADTATIDKKEGIEHFSDGVRYLTEYKFPIRLGTKVATRGFGF